MVQTVTAFRASAVAAFYAATLYFACVARLYLPAAVTLIAGTAYFAMLQAPEDVEGYRALDWTLTTPVLLYVILRAARVPPARIFLLLVADVLMIATGYLAARAGRAGGGSWDGAQQRRRKKLMWFALGVVLLLPILHALATASAVAGARAIALFTLAIWTLYPIVWLLGDMGTLDDDALNETYAVLDVVAKVGFGLLLLG